MLFPHEHYAPSHSWHMFCSNGIGYSMNGAGIQGGKLVKTLPSNNLLEVADQIHGLDHVYSLESKIIPSASVRNGDIIEIVNRFSPDSGPGWLQIRTKSGRLGWIIASGVKEQKTKNL